MINARDLKRGEVIERMVLAIIKWKYPKARKIDGYCKDWDIFVPEKNFGIEVKSDEKSRYTGNIVVEYEFGGQPSALATTKAEFWVFHDGIHFVWITVENIKKCLKENGLKPVVFTGKGDTKSKKAFLVKKDLLWKYSSAMNKVETIENK